MLDIDPIPPAAQTAILEGKIKGIGVLFTIGIYSPIEAITALYGAIDASPDADADTVLEAHATIAMMRGDGAQAGG